MSLKNISNRQLGVLVVFLLVFFAPLFTALWLCFWQLLVAEWYNLLKLTVG